MIEKNFDKETRMVENKAEIVTCYKLKSESASLGSRVKFMHPEFIADIAEDCLPEEA